MSRTTAHAAGLAALTALSGCFSPGSTIADAGSDGTASSTSADATGQPDDGPGDGPNDGPDDSATGTDSGDTSTGVPVDDGSSEDGTSGRGPTGDTTGDTTTTSGDSTGTTGGCAGVFGESVFGQACFQ